MAEPPVNEPPPAPADAPAEVRPAERAPAARPAASADEGGPSRRTFLLSRVLYLVVLVTVSLLPFVGPLSEADFGATDYLVAFLLTFFFGVGVLVLDALTPRKRLSTVFAISLGVVAGLVVTLALGALIDLVANAWSLDQEIHRRYTLLIKLALGISLCYLAVSIVLNTKDDFRLVIPYVEFSKQMRGVRPLLLDTSVLVDGRLDQIAGSGFLDAPLVVPQFVLHELQTLADSSDRLKRERGRLGLDVVRRLQDDPAVEITIDPTDPPGEGADDKLLRMAAAEPVRLVTTDQNLVKVADIHGVSVLNLNMLANAMRPSVLAGDELRVAIVRRGEGKGQGVGHLPDGTMIVVEDAIERVGEELDVVVVNVLQTSAGRMAFARIAGAPEPPSRSLAEAATEQPKTPAAKPPAAELRQAGSRDANGATDGKDGDRTPRRGDRESGTRAPRGGRSRGRSPRR